MQYAFYIGVSYAIGLTLMIGYGIWLYKTEKQLIQKLKSIKGYLHAKSS